MWGAASPILPHVSAPRLGEHVRELAHEVLDVGVGTKRSGTQFMGRGVHTAARIGALAEGGEILASRSTVEAAGSSLPTSNAREATLKGISEPVPIVAIGWR